jgi:hypothetical protein
MSPAATIETVRPGVGLAEAVGLRVEPMGEGLPLGCPVGLAVCVGLAHAHRNAARMPTLAIRAAVRKGYASESRFMEPPRTGSKFEPERVSNGGST